MKSFVSYSSNTWYTQSSDYHTKSNDTAKSQGSSVRSGLVEGSGGVAEFNFEDHDDGSGDNNSNSSGGRGKRPR